LKFDKADVSPAFGKTGRGFDRRSIMGQSGIKIAAL
jgi:hypothetical protein